MSGLGDGARNRGDVRPRTDCRTCGRSTAVTFDKRTGHAFMRAHNAGGVRCLRSNWQVSREDVYQPSRRPVPSPVSPKEQR